MSPPFTATCGAGIPTVAAAMCMVIDDRPETGAARDALVRAPLVPHGRTTCAVTSAQIDPAPHAFRVRFDRVATARL